MSTEMLGGKKLCFPHIMQFPLSLGKYGPGVASVRRTLLRNEVLKHKR